MSKLAVFLILAAAISLLVAILIKVNTIGRIVPGSVPLNWARIADTCLLFSIAISLMRKK